MTPRMRCRRNTCGPRSQWKELAIQFRELLGGKALILGANIDHVGKVGHIGSSASYAKEVVRAMQYGAGPGWRDRMAHN